jgi:hypothetical protein
MSCDREFDGFDDLRCLECTELADGQEDGLCHECRAERLHVRQLRSDFNNGRGLRRCTR